MDSVRSGLENYFVPILGQSKLGPTPDLRPVGSGTLVQINDVHYILTAAHVWHVARDFNKIHFVLTTRTPSAFAIPSEHISANELWDDQASEWGPDLALLKIAPHYASTIMAHKSFLNLSQQKTILAEHPPKTDRGLWAIMGMEGEACAVHHHPEIRTTTANVICQAFLSTINQTHVHQGYDYLDIGAALTLSGVPSSFGGVSGGGLWQIDLSKDKSGIISWNGKRYFRGVAFWESPSSDGRRVIRTHGPQSIFEKAWMAWGFTSPSPAPRRR